MKKSASEPAERRDDVTTRDWNPALAATYDRVAEPYAEQFFDELARKPFDRDRLDRFAGSVRGRGLVCDLGCGPGQVARYLAERGVDAFGLDLSAGMVAIARRLSPTLRLAVGDLRALGLADGALAGIAAFYSVIHLERAAAPAALREMARVLHPGGRLLLAFHGGTGEVHADDWFGRTVSIDATLFEPDEMETHLRAAGFEVDDVAARNPYPFEYPTRRVYVDAVRPHHSAVIVPPRRALDVRIDDVAR